MELGIVIVLTVVALALYFGSNYKTLMRERTEVEAMRIKLDEALTRRHGILDAIGRPFPGKQQELWDALLEKKNAAQSIATNSDASARATLEDEYSQALGQYFAALQKEPEVLESEEFARARDSVLEVEDQVTSTRTDFNTLAARYTMQQNVFPTSMFAKKLGLRAIPEMQFEGAFERYPLKFKPTMPEKKPPLYLQQGGNNKGKQGGAKE